MSWFQFRNADFHSKAGKPDEAADVAAADAGQHILQLIIRIILPKLEKNGKNWTNMVQYLEVQLFSEPAVWIYLGDHQGQDFDLAIF